MRGDESLADLPEAMPLSRVAPFWRILALIEMIGLLAMAIGLIVMAMALLLAGSSRQASLVTAKAAVPATVSSVAAPQDDDSEGEEQQGNLPYPVKQDAPKDSKAANPARERFLKMGQEVWRCPQNTYVTDVVVSPDGQNLAYFLEDEVIAGPFGNAQVISKNESGGSAGLVFGGVSRTAFNPNKPTGIPAWSTDSRSILFSGAGGRLEGFQLLIPGPSSPKPGPFYFEHRGSSPCPLPTNPAKVIFVRTKPGPKVEIVGTPAPPDPTEVVMGDIFTGQVQVLVPVGEHTWKFLAASPDGMKLALVSESQGGEPAQVFVMDLPGGKPRALKIPPHVLGPVCWTPSSKYLIYACHGHYPNAWQADLYQFELETGPETCLSRGGGFSSPSISANGELFYLTHKVEGKKAVLCLMRAELEAVRRFAGQEPVVVYREAKDWVALADQVFKESGFLGDVDLGKLDAGTIAKIVAAFKRLFREHFHVDPPNSMETLDQQRRELQGLTFEQPARARIRLLAGLVEGEFLRQHSGGEWRLIKGPLGTRSKPEKNESESPFGFVYNPFVSFLGLSEDQDEEEFSPAMVYLLKQAAGRPFVLSNDAASANRALATMVDADLQKGRVMLEQKRSNQGEQLLLKMLEKTPHKKNYFLALQVGKILYDAGRLEAVRRLMVQQCNQEPADARKFNLLGLALLKSQPRLAIDHFQKAIRSELYFGPAYLNLAEAYQQAKDINSARLCLQRYLRLMPLGPYARDASQRLAAMSGGQ